MKVRPILLLSLIFYLSGVFAQERKPIFLGIQPAMTKEKFYDEDEFDINIFPIVFQRGLNERIDLRLISIVNYRFGPEPGISDVGIFTLLPYHFKKKEDKFSRSSGIYAGPLLGYVVNDLSLHHTATIGIEAGYLFASKNRFTLSAGVQAGGSYFIYYHTENEWTDHLAIKINLGFWL